MELLLSDISSTLLVASIVTVILFKPLSRVEMMGTVISMESE